jgi:hypothetical protein
MHLNVDISEEAYRHAKLESARAGMLLRKWVERRILEDSPPPAKSNGAARTAPTKDYEYVPLGEDG